MSRKAENRVDKIFLKRWSPRAMSGKKVSDKELMSLFEAAKWAPSSYNGQPWRFVYAKKDGKYWDSFFNLLVEGNQGWCKNAGVLVILVSRKTFEHNNKPSKTHSFDSGAAWENLALQGSINGLVVHGMEGFDYGKAKKMLKLKKDYEVEMMFAVGKPGKIKDLPDSLRKMEKPNSRKKLSKIVFNGKLK